MLSETVLSVLDKNSRPYSLSEYEEKVQENRRAGRNIPALDPKKIVATQEIAAEVLRELGVDEDSLFFYVMKKCQYFPKGNGEEINNLREVWKESKDGFWDEEFPDLTDRYLPLSSIEGEGSYFYGKNTGGVYDVDWAEMAELAENRMEPRWSTFEDFLNWYYDQ